MLSEVAIHVEALGKQYRVGTAPAYGTFRDALSSLARLPARLLRSDGSGSAIDRFWALKDVSFEVKRGEVVGIIGRNGAGKSTLLKVLSRITEPTEGGADIFGRVGSLLEVGTGFHPELTGRENIFLNGAILGMRRAEILRKFGEIVAFAEVEKFIDTPVKHFSSGMYMRLAFAVAAHLDPEILIVDEVLAVGDAEFQKKCLGKMGEVARHGRTVLFVSHNMAAISLLCGRAVVLDHGRTKFIGPAREAVNRYLEGAQPAGEDLTNRPRRTNSWRFVRANAAKSIFDPAEPKEITFHIVPGSFDTQTAFVRGVLLTEQMSEVAQFESKVHGLWFDSECRGRVRIMSPWLKPGRYFVDLYLCGRSAILDMVERACAFDVSPALPYEYGMSPESTHHGLVLADFQWQMDESLSNSGAEPESPADIAGARPKPTSSERA